MNRKKARRLLLAAVLALTAPVLAEEAVVKLPTANVLTNKSAASARVVQLRRGDKVDVLAREGTWLRVKAGDKEGYLHQNSVALAGSNDPALSGGSSAAASLSTAEAGKGVGESIAWAKSTGRNTAGLDRMIALRGEVNATEWDKFTTDGNVGPAKK